MKTCPVCDAIAFDDAVVCYGCLHRFDEDEPSHDEGGEENVAQATSPAQQVLEFLIRFTPATSPSGAVTWSCAVEPVSC